PPAQQLVPKEPDLPPTLREPSDQIEEGHSRALSQTATLLCDLSHELNWERECQSPPPGRKREPCGDGEKGKQHSPYERSSGFPDKITLSRRPVQHDAGGECVAISGRSLPPLAEPRHRCVMVAHVMSKPPNSPARRAESEADFVIFAGDQVGS